MRNNTTEYPRPVLNEYLNDFSKGTFELVNPTFEETSDSIILNLSYRLDCPGIEKLIVEGYAKAVVRITCFRTSYREVFELMPMTETKVILTKNLVADSIDLQCIIISTQPYDSYRLEEFNKNFFGDFTFVLRKGDVVANEPGIKIKLHTILEKNAAGVVLIAPDSNVDIMKVVYAKQGEADPAFSGYIVILLPEKEYKTYLKLKTKKHLKFGIERFLQSTLILPVIVEAIALIKEEESTVPSEVEDHYLGTLWADSIMSALEKHGINDILSTEKTCVELANIILGDVSSDAINDLMEKMSAWSTIRQEEDI